MASVGEGTIINANQVDLISKDLSQEGANFARANAFARSFQAAGTASADTNVDVDLTSMAHIGQSAVVTAPEAINIISRQDDVKTSSTATTRISAGLTGSLFSDAHNQLDANSEVETETGSQLSTKSLFVQAETPTVQFGHELAADADGLETGAGAGGGLHRGHQAVGVYLRFVAGVPEAR